MRKLSLAVVIASTLTLGSIALAQFENHPHLRAAREHIAGAVAELRAANDGKKQYGEHRDRAEELLRQAQGEIDEAATYANSHR